MNLLRKNWRFVAALALFATPALAQTISYSLGSAAFSNIGTSGANVPLLNGTNAWTGMQTITLTTEQWRLAYDGTFFAPFTVSSTGSLTIAPQGGTAATISLNPASTSGTAAGVLQSTGATRFTWGSTNFSGNGANGGWIKSGSSSATVPGIGPDKADVTNGIGRHAAGSPNAIVNSLEVGFWDAGGYNGIVGATTPAAGGFTTVTASGVISSATDIRLNNAAFTRVAVPDGGGGFAGGYNINYSAGVVHAATGNAAGVYYGTDGTIKVYAEGSQMAGAAAQLVGTWATNGDYTGIAKIRANTGFNFNGTNGITVTCTVIPTGITIQGGIITAVTGGTCV